MTAGGFLNPAHQMALKCVSPEISMSAQSGISPLILARCSLVIDQPKVLDALLIGIHPLDGTAIMGTQSPALSNMPTKLFFDVASVRPFRIC
jgi:hypothetical protein